MKSSRNVTSLEGVALSGGIEDEGGEREQTNLKTLRSVSCGCCAEWFKHTQRRANAINRYSRAHTTGIMRLCYNCSVSAMAYVDGTGLTFLDKAGRCGYVHMVSAHTSVVPVI